MANKINVPIPQNPIGENFAWRDWLQKLANRVYGSIAIQNSNNVDITGGTIDGVAMGSTTPSVGSFTTLSAANVSFTNPTPITSGGTGANTAANARTNLGLGTAATHAATDFDASGAAAAVLASSLQISNNLSDVASASTARTNLGLGSGYTGTVALAKLTPVTGSNGSLTVTNGIITAYSAPT
jgi:hypothetical protein